MKIKLLYNPNVWSNLSTSFLQPIWNEYFDLIPIQEGLAYDPSTHLIYANFLTADDWIHPWLAQGYRVFVDHLWDTWHDDRWHTTENMYVLRGVNFAWYNESLWYQSLGYNNYVPNRINDKSFLMLMNFHRQHRDQIYNRLQPILGDSIYSYHGQGITLQGADDIDVNDVKWQRYMNPDWYDRTKFSLVVETTVDYTLSHSEKTYKPMAFQHPTITWGPVNFLKFLHEQGFESFENIVDESYDLVTDHAQRLDIVVAETERLNSLVKQDPRALEDSVTKEKILHNYNRFYNRTLIIERFKKEIIDVIINFYEHH